MFTSRPSAQDGGDKQQLLATSNSRSVATRWPFSARAGGKLLLLLSLLALLGASPALAKVGHITEFPLPKNQSFFQPSPLVRGSDGNLYFSMGNIGRITPAGKITPFTNPGGGTVNQLTLGPDGNIWFIEEGQYFAQVGFLTPAGKITEFIIPPFKNGFVAGNFIIAGPDGNIWLTANTFSGRQLSNGFIGRVTPAGKITEFGTPTALSDPEGIAVGSDGNIWFNEQGVPAVGRLSLH